jgi:hypothetical protein
MWMWKMVEICVVDITLSSVKYWWQGAKCYQRALFMESEAHSVAPGTLFEPFET